MDGLRLESGLHARNPFVPMLKVHAKLQWSFCGETTGGSLEQRRPIIESENLVRNLIYLYRPNPVADASG